MYSVVVHLQSLAEFRVEYNRRRVAYNLVPTETAILAYDAVWSLALALNASIEMVCHVTYISC